jgi:hypothetical protein
LPSAAGASEGVEVLLVGFGERVQELLGCLDLRVPHPFHDALEVGSFGQQPAASSQQPGGVGVAQVVHPDREVDAGGGDGGLPNPGAEGVAGERAAGGGGEEQLVAADAVGFDVTAVTIAKSSGGGYAPTPASLSVPANASPAVTSGATVLKLPSGTPTATTYTATSGTLSSTSCVIQK